MTEEVERPRKYELVWRTGQVEYIEATGVLYSAGSSLSGLGDGEAHIQFRLQTPDHWKLVLSAAEDQLKTIRDVTEEVPV